MASSRRLRSTVSNWMWMVMGHQTRGDSNPSLRTIDLTNRVDVYATLVIARVRFANKEAVCAVSEGAGDRQGEAKATGVIITARVGDDNDGFGARGVDDHAGT